MKKTIKTRVLFSIIISFVAMLAALLCWKSLSPSGFRATQWIPGKTFAEVEEGPPFVGRIESVKQSTSGPLMDNETGKPVEGTNEVQHVTIYVTVDGGKELGIHKENPSPSELRLVSRLRIGQKYRFPEALQH